MLVEEDVLCYHCGQPCEEPSINEDDKSFCCYGCKVVYEIINANQLCQYYSFEDHPGLKVEPWEEEAYQYLDENNIRKKLIEFDTEHFARVRFTIPAIHCVSCIWLLENLQKADPGILRTEVNFSGKSACIDFNPEKIKLSKLAGMLASLGYAPRVNTQSEVEKKLPANTSLMIRLAVAGFCFGNVMLFAFPEYLGLDRGEVALRHLFSWLSIGLSLPVLIFSARDYFHSAWKSFAQRQINIDVPIAVGLLALFGRSVWDIVIGYGPGYLDSFTGLVFFLLIGRWFQSKTYEALAFDRDYKSYFPLAVQKLAGNTWKPVVIHELIKGDFIKIRNLEIVPADSLLIDTQAFLDYSFVTGESKPQLVKEGDKVFAGGRLLGQPVTLQVEKETAQSHLTSLWNHDAFRKAEESKYKKIIDRAARRFTWIVLAIAFITALYWVFVSPTEMWLVLTSVLMVACPCALALAAPFTYGSMLRAFGRHHLYLKNADVIERLASIDAIVFDKTGTVTHGQSPEVIFSGVLSSAERGVVKLLTSYSTHPLSSIITKSLHEKTGLEVTNFREMPGQGIEGSADGYFYRIGAANFVGQRTETNENTSRVFVGINGQVRGFFAINTNLRANIKKMVERLGPQCVALLSGDGDGDKARMRTVFSQDVELRFNQSPHDKMEFIRVLQHKGKKVLMVGDGLNDAGALRQSDVGIAVTDDTGIFTPACDGILRGDQMESLDKFLKLAMTSTIILKTAFIISFLYNSIALTVAVSGHLTPLVAAVLMPVSSISVVSFSTMAVNYVTRKISSDK